MLYSSWKNPHYDDRFFETVDALYGEYTTRNYYYFTRFLNYCTADGDFLSQKCLFRVPRALLGTLAFIDRSNWVCVFWEVCDA